VLYIVHFTAFCLGGPFFSGHGVVNVINLIVHINHIMSLMFSQVCGRDVIGITVWFVRFASQLRLNNKLSHFSAYYYVTILIRPIAANSAVTRFTAVWGLTSREH